MKKRLFIGGYILFFLCSCLCNCKDDSQKNLSVKPVSEIISEFTTYVEKTCAEWKLPGLAVAVIDKGEIRYINLGSASLEKKEPVTENSIFSVMSLSKVVTVTILMQLVDEGKVSLDDKIIKYVPIFKLKDENSTNTLTIRNVLNHTAGLPHYSCDSLWHLGFSKDEIIKKLALIDVKAKPGELFGYQNIVFGIIGDVIEKVLQKPLRLAAKERIFDKLEMDLSEYLDVNLGFFDRIMNFFHKDEKKEKLEVTDYYTIGGKIVPHDGRKRSCVFIGTSGVRSCVADYIKFIDCLMNDGIIQFGANKGKQLISKESADFMRNPNIMIKSRSDYSFPLVRLKEDGLGYGAGLYCVTYCKDSGGTLNTNYHPGAGGGCRSYISFSQDAKVGLVVFSNFGPIGTNFAPESIVCKFWDLLLEYPDFDWSERNLNYYKCREKTKSDLNEYTFRMDKIEAGKLVGKYQNNFYGDVSVYEEKNDLFFSYRGEKTKLKHVSGLYYTFEPWEISSRYSDTDSNIIQFDSSGEDGISELKMNLFNESDCSFGKVGK